MARENTLKKYLLKTMGTTWDAQSHEDRFSEGIPDISFGTRNTNGWIELKHLKKWPKNPDALVKPEKYTPQQVNWITKRGKKAGHCFILFQIDKDYFLFNYEHARAIRFGLTKQQIEHIALSHWYQSIDPVEFMEALFSV